MAKGIIKDEVFNRGAGNSSFEVKHETTCLVIPDGFSIGVDVHAVPVDLVIEQLVESWLISVHFGSLQIEVLEALLKGEDFELTRLVGIEEAALVSNGCDHLSLLEAFLFCIGWVATRTIDIQDVTKSVRLQFPEIVIAGLLKIFVAHREDESGNRASRCSFGRNDWYLIIGKLEVELRPEGIEA